MRAIWHNASLGVCALSLGALLLSLKVFIDHVGWLILSRGTNMLSSTQQPYWDIYRKLDMINLWVLHAGIVITVASVYLIVRALKQNVRN